MAKDVQVKAEKASASADERIYTVPLRSAWIKVPRNKRVKKSVNTIRLFLNRHMHSDNVKISRSLNEQLWYRGIEKPPGKIKIKVRKNKEGVVWARLPNELDIEDKGNKGRVDKLKDRLGGKKETPVEKLASKLEKKKGEIKAKKEEKPLEKVEPKTEEKPKNEPEKEEKPKEAKKEPKRTETKKK
ncbi:MAG: 50S ribosomal protein L31e [Nanoarchaeota archaeon]